MSLEQIQPDAHPAEPSADLVSEAQLSANRSNAQHSTGPRTPEGKARVAQNAIKHGLFARDANLALKSLGEDPAEFAALLADLQKDCVPEGRREEELVHNMAELRWRLARLQHFSQRVLQANLDEGVDALAAVQDAEGIGSAEGRLLRALSRLNRDLVFLQRYRLAQQQRLANSARKPSEVGFRELMADFDMGTERLVHALNRRAAHSKEDFDPSVADDELDSLDVPADAQNPTQNADFSPVKPRVSGESLQPDQRPARKSREQSQFAHPGQAA
jgi:hypothetical protein